MSLKVLGIPRYTFGYHQVGADTLGFWAKSQVSGFRPVHIENVLCFSMYMANTFLNVGNTEYTLRFLNFEIVYNWLP